MDREVYVGRTGTAVRWMYRSWAAGRVDNPVRPSANFHLTRGGDDSSSRHREFADGQLLVILLYGGMAYPLSTLYVTDILLDLSEKAVKRPNNVTSNSLELVIVTTSPLPSVHHTPNVKTTIDYGSPSIDVLAASTQLGARAEPDAPVAVEENAEDFEELLGYSNSHTPESEEAEPVTTIPEPLPSPSHTSLDATSDDFTHEQREAVVHELRLLFHVLEEQACRGQARTAWASAPTEVREEDPVEQVPVEENIQQDTFEETPVEEDVQREMEEEASVEDVQNEEVHQRRKRRGGKRNTAWKNKRRQDKEDRERDSEASPSGSR
ncbi:hypothetical protein FS837_009043 [Tulasnella sp. UAMH 9824]|nr:hypothetical protein FS837_009043 [Tulasnella sp. UAMH 9824]